MPADSIDPSGYQRFAAELRAGGFAPAAEPGAWDAELVAAHVVMNNDFWTDTARRVSAGEQPTYDNEPAVDAAELTDFVARVGGLSELATEIERSAADLAAAFESLSDDDSQRPVMVRIRDNGELVVDEPRPIASMLIGNATFHQAMHLEQLLALRLTPWPPDTPLPSPPRWPSGASRPVRLQRELVVQPDRRCRMQIRADRQRVDGLRREVRPLTMSRSTAPRCPAARACPSRELLGARVRRSPAAFSRSRRWRGTRPAHPARCPSPRCSRRGAPARGSRNSLTVSCLPPGAAFTRVNSTSVTGLSAAE